MDLTQELIAASVYGGAFYGGGGGGALADGFAFASAALSHGTPRLVDAEELPADTIVFTCGLVGAPAAREQHYRPRDFKRSVELLALYSGQSCGGFITNENGAFATVNGWLQAACFDLPLIDCPANGRAHPTALIGSMGLDQEPGYVSYQVAVGGSREDGRYLEMVGSGSLANVSAMTRQTAVLAGGMVAVCRNPLPLEYIHRNGASGAIKQAIAMGRVIQEQQNASHQLSCMRIAEAAQGAILGSGKISGLRLHTSGGFDSGRLVIDGDAGRFVISIWNEYLSLRHDGLLRCQFPDLITLISRDTNLPLNSADARLGQQVSVIHVPSAALKLGRGVFIPQNMQPLAEIIQREGGAEEA